jgi:hypothetical protein
MKKKTGQKGQKSLCLHEKAFDLETCINIWAVVSLGVGILWILVERRKSKQGGVT